jgi:membrane protein YdbS with pleckstrin-like domain
VRESFVMRRTFKSKVDTWIAAVAIGPGLLIAPLVMLLVWRTGGLTPSSIILFAVVIVFSVGLPVWVFLTTTYEITSDTLRIRAGPLREQVPLAEIERITTSRSWESAPALSLDRMRITFAGGRTVLISPEDERGFLATLRGAGVEAARDVSPTD